MDKFKRTFRHAQTFVKVELRQIESIATSNIDILDSNFHLFHFIKREINTRHRIILFRTRYTLRQRMQYSVRFVDR